MLFEKVVGHLEIKNLFKAAIHTNTLGNSYIFSGTEGIGKKLFAIELVKSINCLDSKIKLPCNTCNNCLRIDKNIFPDLVTIEPDGKIIKIDQIRELIKDISYLPVENRRVIIANDAHLMNIQASNTFLKTLEDSSSNNIFILITSKIYSLPQTIISRCQNIKFSPLKNEEVFCILKNLQISHDRSIIKSFAGGSVAQAMALSEKFTVSEVQNVIETFSNLSHSTVNKIFSFADYLTNNFKNLSDIITIFKILYLDIIRYQLNLDTKFLGLNESKDSENYLMIIKNLAAKNSLNNNFKKFTLINKTENYSNYNLNKKLAIESFIMELL